MFAAGLDRDHVVMLKCTHFTHLFDKRWTF